MKNGSSYNPDVLNCLANLSNDEVFTPPTLANQVLDMLPQELFSNPNTKFLDPVSKSGVFLREIVKRLDRGLMTLIPDRKERINHIMHHQVFGIAITELTAHLSRRSLYCSKEANSPYSVSHFDTEAGNILYEPLHHTWVNGKCRYCGASQEVYDRGDEAEQYAYQYIHTDNPNTLFNNMKFDVIIGNPPYQLSDGGGKGSSAIPLYQKFVEQSVKLNPRYLSMIIPARWYSGGKGLDSFREFMLTNNKISHLTDYFDSTECFPGIDLSGGVCIFLWEKDYKGECSVTTIRKGKTSTLKRPLLENNNKSFIRFNDSIPIIRKIQAKDFISIEESISARKPFGDITNIRKEPFSRSILVYAYPNNGYVSINNIYQGQEFINKYKVLIAKAYGERGDFPYLVLGKPFLAEINSCCTETYIILGSYDNKESANNLISYVKTKFFRFLALQKKNTQNAAKGVYSFVPLQDFSHPWTDEMLYKKYGLTEEEIAFIESMIRPME